eukprot:558621-Hanusia_phi.AAC.1
MSLRTGRQRRDAARLNLGPGLAKFRRPSGLRQARRPGAPPRVDPGSDGTVRSFRVRCSVTARRPR